MTTLLPHLAAVQVEGVEAGEGLLRIAARTCGGEQAECPGCGTVSRHEHSRYVRHLDDCAVGGRAVRIDLSVRRWYCENPACTRATFVEQVSGLTVRYQRRTPQLQQLLAAVAVALGGRAGARLASVLHATVSWATLLHLVMGLADPAAAVPRVLGVDDFALRKGQNYATLLVDCLTRLPIEVWAERDAQALQQWLAGHPGVRVVCRDGSAAYRAGITAGAPDAVQVSDRFHLWQGLVRQVKKTVAAHRACLRAEQCPPSCAADGRRASGEGGSGIDPEGRLAVRVRATHAAVHGLLDQKLGIRAVARRLRMGQHTVQRYARAEHWQEVVKGWPKKPSRLDPYRGYLLRRWSEGCTSARRLYEEISERGFTGSYDTVCLFLRPRSRLRAQEAAVPQPPTVPEVVRWLTCRPTALTEDETTRLKQILAACPELSAAHTHIRDFAAMLTHDSAADLPAWIEQVRTSDLPGLSGFAAGLLDDLDAVTAGLSTPYSSGVVEGRVTDAKLIKRQMAGRSGIPLLRKRILLVAASRRPPHKHTTDTTTLWETTPTKIL